MGNTQVSRHKRDSYPIRKIKRTGSIDEDDIKNEIDSVLADQLQLERPWIKRNFVLEDIKEHDKYSRPSAGARFSGLSTCSVHVWVSLSLKDVEADGVAGVLGLPEGSDFE